MILTIILYAFVYKEEMEKHRENMEWLNFKIIYINTSLCNN
jgi:hypothetical protein